MNEFQASTKSEQIGYWAKWTALALGLVSPIVQLVVLHQVSKLDPIIAMARNIYEPSTASFSDWIAIWRVFWNSAPLTLAFILLGTALRTQKLPLNPSGIGISAFVLSVAAAFGNELGYPYIVIPPLTNNYYESLERILIASANGYGATLFISSLIVSIFLVYAYQIWSSDD